MTRTLVLLSTLVASPALAAETQGVDTVPADDLVGDFFGVPEAPAPQAIINGEAVERDVFPEAGGLLVSGRVEPGFGGGGPRTLKQFVCSSTLIAPDVVLLAAHCIDPMVLSMGGTAEDLEFRWSRKIDLTRPALPTDPWPQDAVVATEVVFPPEWSINSMQDFGLDDPKYDIALMFLSEPVLDVPYAILPTPEEAELIQSGTEVEIVGWGMQDPIGIQDSFSPPRAGSFGFKHWGRSFVGEVGDYEFQVGATPDDTRKCRGDSGGPTFMKIEDADTVESYRLIGVTSRSADFSLCETRGGFDTRVDAYTEWINEEMEARCADGTRAWCDEPGIVPATALDEGDPEKTGGCVTAPLALPGVAGILAALAVARRRD